MATLSGCVWEMVSEDSLLVTYCGDDATAEQWRAYLTMLRGFKGRGSLRFLIYADTVPPRDVLVDITSVARGAPWQVALISPSTAVRFAASTFTFVVKTFRFFSPEKINDALDFLACDGEPRQRALSALARLRASAGVSLPG